MRIQQFYLGCLAHASYIVSDEATGRAAVVDPQRDIDIYLKEAEAQGLRFEYVLLTHFHADFLAGHLELSARTGARIGLGSRGRAEYDFVALDDGAHLSLGETELTIWHTPGHTPESICLLVGESGGPPQAVLSGDTLFVGDVGRPDLRAALGSPPRELGRQLYASLQRLLTLPDATQVYPAHGPGSLCGKQLGRETVTTIGLQRHANYALQPMDCEAFVDLVLADQPEAPAYFTYDAVLNTRRHPGLEEALQENLRPLTLADVQAARAAGAQLLDTRPARAFAHSHLAGSLLVGLDGAYATWCGTLLDRERPIVLICQPGAEREAALRLGRIGFDNLAGYLQGGLAACADRAELLAGFPRLSRDELRAQLSRRAPMRLLDVRGPGERARGHVEGSVSCPLPGLAAAATDWPRTEPIVAYCQGGYRSAIAASLLLAQGFTNVRDLEGGYAGFCA